VAFVRKPRLPANVLDIAGINFPVPGTDPNKAIIPSDNPITGDTDSLSKIELGRRIFFDTNLSAEDEIDIACATCHQPERAFTDGKTVAIGIAKGIRNTPSINNMVFKSRFSWDGSVRSLEEQVVLPFTNPVEMGQDSFQTVVDLINADQHHYAVLLNQAFDGVATPENIAQALASFVRAQVVGNSKVDQYLAGDVSALDTTEAAGLAVFKNKGRCFACHRLEDDFGSPASSTFLVNTGLLAPTDDTGNGYGEFVVPSLRNVSLTDPYFHDKMTVSVGEFHQRCPGRLVKFTYDGREYW